MNRSNGVKLLLLDCDGVLIRSERANLAYYNHLFRAFGLPEVAEDDAAALARLHTLSTPQVIETFFPPEARDEARAFAEGLDYLRFLPLLEPEPGWREVLARRRGFQRVAVATNRGRSAHEVLASVGLLDLVDRVVTVRDVARPKPHPDLLLRALDLFGCPPAEALYVGDSELDLSAARAAGVAFLGFRTPFPPSVGSPREVATFLANHGTSGTLPGGVSPFLVR
ncbi:MAG: HAD-IA family hydrolase [Deltaproteobacteria bacterium]|nr:HAD-IA family hydrolase [Deltaproteobacteria bacterium]